MKKFETIEDLAKAAGQLAGYFTKNADFHKAAHAAHAGLNAHHEAQAAFHKAAHDAMDDGHEMKAHIGKVHEHHVAKAAHHKAMADLHKGYMEDSTKLAAAYGSEPELQKTAPASLGTAGEGSDMAAILKAAFNENIASIKDSPEFKEVVKNLALSEVKKMFGNAVVPDGARVVVPGNPPEDVLKHLQLVPRGSSGASLEKAVVDPDMEDAFAI